jgi:hypothetical protein
LAGTPVTDDATITFAVDNSQAYNVVARRRCQRIFIQEDYDSATPPTADLVQAIPAGASGVRISKGTAAIYTPPSGATFFERGDIAGTIKTSSGSITVQQIHSQRI